MQRKKVSTGTPWEKKFGYCRAVRVGNLIEVAGTTAMKNGKLVGKGKPALQTKTILKIIEAALKELGASLEDVVRTRMYVADIRHMDLVASMHGTVFSKIQPASTLVQVTAFADPEMLVEIEATAYLKN